MHILIECSLADIASPLEEIVIPQLHIDGISFVKTQEVALFLHSFDTNLHYVAMLL